MDQPRELRIVAVNGMLGYGFEATSLRAGMAERPHLVGGDSGSSDPGPYYLGSGASLVKPEQLRRDLGLALSEARAAGAPLVIGSAAMGGGAPHRADRADGRRARTRGGGRDGERAHRRADGHRAFRRGAGAGRGRGAGR